MRHLIHKMLKLNPFLGNKLLISIAIVRLIVLVMLIHYKIGQIPSI